MSLLLVMTSVVRDTDLSRVSQRQGMGNITVTSTWFQMILVAYGETPVMEVLYFI